MPYSLILDEARQRTCRFLGYFLTALFS